MEKKSKSDDNTLTLKDAHLTTIRMQEGATALRNEATIKASEQAAGIVKRFARSG